MVAFAKEYLPAESPARSQNRAECFFARAPGRAGHGAPASRFYAGGNDRCHYDACQGASLAQGNQLQDCYDAANKSYSSSIEHLGRLENDRTEAVFENLVNFDEIAKQNFNIAVFDTVDTVFRSMAVGAAGGWFLSYRYARVADSANRLYRSARSMASVSRLGSLAARNQHLANNLAVLGGIVGGTSYSFAVGNFNSGATILDFAIGDNGFGSITLGINQNVQNYIDASGVSNETAAAIIGGIKSSTNRTREVLDARLSEALSECDKKYK